MKFHIYLQFAALFFGKYWAYPSVASSNKKKMLQHCNKSLLSGISSQGQSNTNSLYYTLPLHSENYRHDNTRELEWMLYKIQANSTQILCTPKWIADPKEDRIPSVIMEAECPKEHSCEEIKYAVSVLEIETCHYGFSVYRQKIESITVGCVPRSEPNALERRTNDKNHVKREISATIPGCKEQENTQGTVEVPGNTQGTVEVLGNTQSTVEVPGNTQGTVDVLGSNQGTVEVLGNNQGPVEVLGNTDATTLVEQDWLDIMLLAMAK